MAEEPKNRRRSGRTPWLKIARAVPVSFDARKIVLGTVVLILIQAGSLALDQVAPGSGKAAPNLLDVDRGYGLAGVLNVPRFNLAFGQVAEPVLLLTGPIVRLLRFNRGIVETGRRALEFLWVIIVMGVVGGAISRSAVVEMARGDRATLSESLRFARRSARSLIAAPLLPIAVATVCVFVYAVVGLLYQVPVVGGTLAAVSLFIPLGLGFVAALLLIELFAALPLIHVSIAADAESSLDAMTRAFGCVNRRPVQFVACVAAAWLMGVATLVVVDFLAGLTLHLAAWGLSLTAPSAIVFGLASAGPGEGAAMTDSWARMAPLFWVKVVRLLAHGWIYGYYWSAAAAIYLVLRRDVDGTPLSEVKDETTAML